MFTRIVVFTDVHGNLPALQAALRQIKNIGCDAIFHTGDAISIGPYPSECLETLLNIPNLHLLMGNHDAWYANGLPQPDCVSDGEVQHLRWTHAAITPDLRSVVAMWPYELHHEFEGVKTTFVHYGLLSSRRDFMPIIVHPTPDGLDSMFGEFDSQLIFYGHHHPFADAQGQARYINPGALGCHTEALARYAVVEFQRGKYEVEHRAVGYDDAPLIEAFEARQVPEREFLYKAFFGGRFQAR